MSLWGPYRILFRPVDPVMLRTDGSVDADLVRSVVIEEVVDYHG